MGTPAPDEQEGGVGDLSRAPFVRVERGLGRPRRPVTALFLHGEHDFGSRELTGDALDALHSDVLIDLSWCTFVDSSIIAMILARHATLAREGYQLEVILPPTHTRLSRVFDRLGARQLLPVRDAPPYHVVGDDRESGTYDTP
jgi:anti-anti-sigma regulatory factor